MKQCNTLSIFIYLNKHFRMCSFGNITALKKTGLLGAKSRIAADRFMKHLGFTNLP